MTERCRESQAVAEVRRVNKYLRLSLRFEPPQMKWPTTLLVLLAAAAEGVYGHTIEVPAGKKECFFEDLHVNDQVRPLCWPHMNSGAEF
jgi:hypothetical protein